MEMGNNAPDRDVDGDGDKGGEFHILGSVQELLSKPDNLLPGFGKLAFQISAFPVQPINMVLHARTMDIAAVRPWGY
jgi:hypothetical protein